jgi:hypothetical protein
VLLFLFLAPKPHMHAMLLSFSLPCSPCGLQTPCHGNRGGRLTRASAANDRVASPSEAAYQVCLLQAGSRRGRAFSRDRR